MLYKGAKPAALYRGAYKPGKLYKGTQLVAGYADVSKAAPASWDGSYDDVVGVAAQGRGKQQTYSGAQLLDISTCTINSVKPYGLTITRDGDVVKIQGTAVPDNVGDLNFFVLLWTRDTAMSGKGYVITPFLLQGSIDRVYGLRTAEETAIACGLILTEGEAVDVALRLMVSVDTPTAYEPYVGGQPSPQPGLPPAAGGGGGCPDGQRADGHLAHYRDAAGAAGHPRHRYLRYAGVHRRRSVAGDATGGGRAADGDGDVGCRRSIPRGQNGLVLRVRQTGGCCR